MISPAELLAEVRSLNTEAMSPARRRTVISRAYYAAYHFLNSSPIASGFSRNRNDARGMHAQFISFLTSATDRKIKLAGRKLNDLYARRIEADYYLGSEITYNMTAEAVADAVEIIEEIFAEEAWAETASSANP